MIRDKQELKRCIKQTVRRAQVVETDFSFDVRRGSMGISELLNTWAAPSGAPNDVLRRTCADGTPFNEDACATFAALSALELPVHNLNNAQTIQQSYDRNAYLREVLDAMNARRVLVRVPSERVGEVVFDDDRFAPMLAIDCTSFFTSGRYGVNYEERSSEIISLLSISGAHDLCADNAGIDIIRFCLIPVSEDVGCVLHLFAENKEDLYKIEVLLDEHPNARIILSCKQEHEHLMIDLAQQQSNLMVKVSEFRHIRYALSKLNTRFIPYTTRAELPEQMLGRWINAREELWPILLDAYLPLARAGYELTSEAVAKDIDSLLGGNLEAFYNTTM